MVLEEAVKKAYEKGFDNIIGFKVDGNIVNLDCKSDAESIFPARIIFNGNKYHTDSAKDIDSIDDFADEIKKYL